MEHIKLTKEGFTHWSSGPGNITFDPECGACWQERCEGREREIATLREALQESCVCGAVEAKKSAMIPTGTWEFCGACKALATEAPQ